MAPIVTQNLATFDAKGRIVIEKFGPSLLAHVLRSTGWILELNWLQNSFEK